MPKKKNKMIVVLVLILCIGIIVWYIKKSSDERRQNILNEQKLIATIKEHYNRYVLTNKETNLYNKDGEIIGNINKDVYLVLAPTLIDKNTKYFKIDNLGEFYIAYSDVTSTEEKIKDDRYKHYIPYNQNVKTESKTTFYNKNNELVYMIKKGIDLPIIIKEKDTYGIEYDNEILYVKKSDVSIYENSNTDKKNTNGVAVLNYHFFYEDGNPDGCYEIICAPKSQLKKHLDYLKEKNILTIKMNELEMYMDGKIQLPKSVLITIDDGERTATAVNLLTEYKMYATIFLISSWYDTQKYYRTEYIELHSHTHNLHNGGKCSGGQGSALKCLDKAFLLDDLKKSRESLNMTTAMAYPFYEYNSYSESVIKEAGFTMAFIGVIGASYGPWKLAEVGGNKLRIPRFPVITSTTMNEIDRYFNEIKST